MSATDTLSPRRSPDPIEPPDSPQYPTRELRKPVPFSDLILLSPPPIIRPDHAAAGLAAALTTNIDNPFFRLPTKQDERNGALPAAFAMYAPYYVGTDMTPEEIALDIAEQAAAFLQFLDSQHGFDGYVGRMLSVLRRGSVTHSGLQGIEDENILFDVHDWLAVITNRLRHLVPAVVVGNKLSSEALEYRAETHEAVEPFVETIEVAPGAGGLEESFVLPELVRSDPDEIVALGWDFFQSWSLRRGAEFAALAAEKVGDPLVRAALTSKYKPESVRRLEYVRESS